MKGASRNLIMYRLDRHVLSSVFYVKFSLRHTLSYDTKTNRSSLRKFIRNYFLIRIYFLIYYYYFFHIFYVLFFNIFYEVKNGVLGLWFLEYFRVAFKEIRTNISIYLLSSIFVGSCRHINFR